MKLEKFDGINRNELSMIEVSHEILQERNKPILFANLINEVQNFLGKSDEEIRDRLPQFYTDLNIDGSFISLGGNKWALRSWYPYESIDEAVIHSDEEEHLDHKKQKINAFLDSDDEDDIIDYDSENVSDDFDEENDMKNYQNKLNEIDDDDLNDDLPDGLEGQLNEFSSHDDD